MVSLVSSFIGLTEDFSGDSGRDLLLEGYLPDMNGKTMLQLDPLVAGRKLTIWSLQSDWSMSESGLAAIIEKISPDKICLRLSKPVPPPPLQEGERVRIKSWTVMALYFWDAEILKVSGSAKQQVTISILDDGLTLQRRDYSGRYTPPSALANS